MGIIGYGRIGRAVAKVARAFGMDVIAYSRRLKNEEDENARFEEIDKIFETADVVSLHCPLTKETEKIVNRERISLMKSTAFLINTGRGGLVDEIALAEALNNGRIAGAAVDVLSTEPPQPSNPLLTAKNCIITPHIGWATKSARERLMKIVVNNIRAFLNGTPVNVVNP
jgi:glycerate dehydrogenase